MASPNNPRASLKEYDAYDLLAENSHTIISEISSDIDKISISLFQQNLIVLEEFNKVTAPEIKATKDEKALAIFKLLLKKIRYFPDQLEVFMRVLEENKKFHEGLLELLDEKIGKILNTTPDHKNGDSKPTKTQTIQPLKKFGSSSTKGNGHSKPTDSTKTIQPLMKFGSSLTSSSKVHSGRLFTFKRESPLWNPHVEDRVLRSELTKGNYKDQFKGLLYHENQAHIKLLAKKCDGSYTVGLCTDSEKSSWIQGNEQWEPEYARYGYIKMTGDQVAYAVQSARRIDAVILQLKGKIACFANILQQNYSHDSNELYIGFDELNAKKLSDSFLFNAPAKECELLDVFIRFELKHSYFRNLNYIVCQFSENCRMVTKIFPTHKSFCVANLATDLEKYKELCSDDQFQALKAIVSCPPRGPPVVITGAFGTGKTRLLALAARYFLTDESKTKKGPTRVLACTQQRISASNFMSMYAKLDPQENHSEVIIVQSYGVRDYRFQSLYKTKEEFEKWVEKSPPRNMVVITTCLTARSFARFLPSDFKFTHILIDEGAQMREPEAIAPLLMADPDNTKIVIAGDDQQVGPGLLVFGDLPSMSSLSKSLLERLHSLYNQFGNDTYASQFVHRLTTNFRSRQAILDLTGDLFYSTKLTVSDGKEPPSHPKYSYPLTFICSSIDEKYGEIVNNTNRKEAEITVTTLTDVIAGWTDKQWGECRGSALCVMSPSRAQLTVIKNCIKETKPWKFKSLSFCPTFDIQGREYRALVLSTAEPINKDGSSKNPPKSFTDRYIFNTAITRAHSLVVAIGNPFQLLQMEVQMITKYGDKGKCWCNYFKRCFENDAFYFDDSLKLSSSKKDDCKKLLKNMFTRILTIPATPVEPSTTNTSTFSKKSQLPSSASNYPNTFSISSIFSQSKQPMVPSKPSSQFTFPGTLSPPPSKPISPPPSKPNPPPPSKPTSPPPSKPTSPPPSKPTSPPPSKLTSPPPSKLTSPPPSKLTSPSPSKPNPPPPSKPNSPPPSKPPTSPPPSKLTSPPPSKLTSPPPSKLTSPPPSKLTSPPPSKPNPPPPSKPNSPPSGPNSPPPSKPNPESQTRLRPSKSKLQSYPSTPSQQPQDLQSSSPSPHPNSEEGNQTKALRRASSNRQPLNLLQQFCVNNNLEYSKLKLKPDLDHYGRVIGYTSSIEVKRNGHIIGTFSGEVQKKIKKAEESAAEKARQSLENRLLQRSPPSTTKSKYPDLKTMILVAIIVLLLAIILLMLAFIMAYTKL